MKVTRPLKVVSMGKYLPKKVMSSDLEKELGIPAGWALKNSGVGSRHKVTFEHNDYMGARAAENALDNAKMSLKDIDLIIAAGGSFDYIIPNQASVIKDAMSDGEKYHPSAIDIDSTCLSFLSAMDIASRMLDGEQYTNILIVSTEISSKHLNPKNWETSTLFGDAAAACIVQYAPGSESHFIKGGQRTYSKGVHNTIIEAGGLKHPFSTVPYDVERHSFQMKGKQLLRMAKNKIPEFMDWFFEDLPYTFDTVPVIIPHQASKMGLVITNNLYNLKPGQMKTTLEKYGNCIAASIPLTLHDCIESGEIKRGDICLLSGTSAGFSIGATLLKF